MYVNRPLCVRLPHSAGQIKDGAIVTAFSIVISSGDKWTMEQRGGIEIIFTNERTQNVQRV